MPIRIQCANCEATLNVAETLQGKTIRCPGCKERVRVQGGRARGTQLARPGATRLSNEGFMERGPRRAPVAGPRQGKKTTLAGGNQRQQTNGQDHDDDNRRQSSRDRNDRPRRQEPGSAGKWIVVVLLLLLAAGGAGGVYWMMNQKQEAQAIAAQKDIEEARNKAEEAAKKAENEAKRAEKAEQDRKEEETKRLEADAKKRESDSLTALTLEKQRQDEAARKIEKKREDDARSAELAKIAAETERLAVEKKKFDDAQRLAEAKRIDDDRIAAEKRKADEAQNLIELQKIQEAERLAAEKRKADEARLIDLQKAQEAERIAAEKKKADEAQRLVEMQKAQDAERIAAEKKKADDAQRLEADRLAAEKRKADDAQKLAEMKKAEEALALQKAEAAKMEEQKRQAELAKLVQAPNNPKQPDPVKPPPVAVTPPAGGLPAIPDGPAPAFIMPETTKMVKKATAYLKVTDATGQQGEGSGFFAMEPGIVMTNAHVVGMLQPGSAMPKKVEIVANSGTSNEMRFEGTVLGADRDNDLAVVRIQGDISKLPAPLAVELDQCSLTELQKVYIFGFPHGASLGKEITASESSVSSFRRDEDGSLFQIQVNGGMHPGNSGGPVVDSRGVVVGVSVAGIKGTQLNFAVPSEKIQGMLHGRVQETHIGEAFLHDKAVKVPLKIKCLDPLNRLREVKIDIWTGPTGPARTTSMKAPANLPGDSPKQSVVLTYQQGLGAHELVLPSLTLPAGHVYWIQPTLTTHAGLQHWAASTTIDPASIAPLNRTPVDLKFSTATSERTLTMAGKFEFRMTNGKEKIVESDDLNFQVLEEMTNDPKGTALRVAMGKGDFTTFEQNKTKPRHSEAQVLVKRKIFTYATDPFGRLEKFGFPQFRPANPVINPNPNPKGKGKIPVQPQPQPLALEKEILYGEAEDMASMFNTSYQLASLSVPNRQVQPLEVWDAKIAILVGAGRGKKTTLDLVMKYTYEGSRTIDGKTMALVTITGELERRNATKEELARRPKSRIVGKGTFDVAAGFFTKLKVAVVTEGEVQGMSVAQILEVNLTRVAGNIYNIGPLPPPGAPPPPPNPNPGPGSNPLPGTKVVGTPVPNAPPQPPPPAAVPGKTTVDLIPLIDPSRDAVHGKWFVGNNVLHCNDQNMRLRIQVPYQPPTEYDYTVTFSQPNPRNGISLIMPNPNGGSLIWTLGSARGKDYGLHTNTDNRQKRPLLPNPFAPNSIHTTTVQVRRDSVTILVDGIVLVNQKTDFRDLVNVDNFFKMPDLKILGLACDDPTVFHYVQVVEITGAGVKSPVAATPAANPTSTPGANNFQLEGKKEVIFSSAIQDACAGAGGKKIIVHMPQEEKLAVFDVVEGKIVGYIPARGARVFFAAGKDQVVLIQSDLKVIETWNLPTLTLANSKPLPEPGLVKSVTMGCNSPGPAMLLLSNGIKALSRVSFHWLNPTTLEIESIQADRGLGTSWRDNVHVRASADGQLFTLWNTEQSPTTVNCIAYGMPKSRVSSAHETAGELLPSASGKFVAVQSGLYGADAKKIDVKLGYCIASLEGDYFLNLGNVQPRNKNATLTADVCFFGNYASLGSLTIDNLTMADPGGRGGDFTLGKRLYFLAESGYLVTIPASNDRVIVQRVTSTKVLPAAPPLPDKKSGARGPNPSRAGVPVIHTAMEIRVSSPIQEVGEQKLSAA